MKGDLRRYREIFYFALEQARQNISLYISPYLAISHYILTFSPCLSLSLEQGATEYISLHLPYLPISPCISSRRGRMASIAQRWRRQS